VPALRRIRGGGDIFLTHAPQVLSPANNFDVSSGSLTHVDVGTRQNPARNSYED